LTSHGAASANAHHKHEGNFPNPVSKEPLVTWRERWHQEGGPLELLRLAIPLILSSSFLTMQLVVDRILLSQSSSDAIAASMPAACAYWTLFMLLQFTANYATTFVAQYVGARRLERVGPAVWQSLYFSLVGGIAFMSLIPLVPAFFRMINHDPAVQELEIQYLHVLCFAALPALIVASVNSFFAGRGETWIVALIDATGMTVNALMAYALIFGHWGLPEMGIRGAGWATVVGSSVSAVLGLAMFFQPKYQARFGTLSGWRFDPELFRRMMRFGLPNGVQAMFEGLSFTVFLNLVGKFGAVQLAATNVAFAINIAGLVPMLGMGQAVGVVVGQRLGQDRPDLAARGTWMGFWMALLYIAVGVLLYLFAPGACMYPFRNDADAAWIEVAQLVPVLLRFVALYSLFDTMNIVFSFALRGAGDTRFVTIISLFLSWPIMVLPTWAALHFGWGLYWAWGFASAYVIALGFTFLFRFQAGKWKTMRVIERIPVERAVSDVPAIPAEGLPALEATN
jgi:MATE family multidrug resistance protein